jgi:hypothetical protein
MSKESGSGRPPITHHRHPSGTRAPAGTRPITHHPFEALPEIVEVKRYLDGSEKRFHCRLIERGDRSAVLLYRSDRPYEVHGLALPAGTVTFGYYWTDRPYNVYHWQRPEGGTIAYYFNLADSTSLAGETIEWRDLTVDVLTTPIGRVDVLDEHELPAELDPALHEAIERAKALVLAGHRTVAAELEARSRALWARVFGGAGSPV